MHWLLTQIRSSLTGERLLSVVAAVALLVGGWLLAKLLSGLLARVLRARFGGQQALLLRRLTFYGIFGLFAAAALGKLGVSVSVLLGTAGILTVAVGFASQTSASNIISGLFLLGERPFVVGDTIRVGATTGEVVAIDLLAVKLRTFDNLSVRVPNEMLLKQEITNLTRYPIRRVDLLITLAHGQSVEHARELMMRIADDSTLCLDEPRPACLVLGFSETGVQLQFSAWAVKERFVELRSTLIIDINLALSEAGIALAQARSLIQLQTPPAAPQGPR